MDSGFVLHRENPKKSANILSKLTFAWMIKLFYKGVRKGLDVRDLYITLKSDKSERLGDKLGQNWEREIARAKTKGRKPSLLRAVADTFLLGYMFWGVLLFIQMVGLRTFQPLVLGYLIRLFGPNHESEDPETEMYISGGILVAVVALSIFLQHHTNFGQQAIGMRIRIAVSTLVYRKMLRLSRKALGQTAAGQIVNLLANDVMRFDMVVIALHYFWIAPFQVGLVTYFIWEQVGIASLAGILSLVFFTLPLQAIMGRYTSVIRAKVAVRTDFRVRLMNEIISGIQVIKMYAWEKPFEAIVKTARLDEVRVIRVANYLRGFFLASMVFVERTTLYLTVITFVLTGNQITADIVFTMAQFFNLLQLAMAIFLPLAIQMGAESLVSLRRLRKFLLLEEKQLSNIEKTTDGKVTLEKVYASWTSEAETLQNINLDIPAGSLCAVIGPVGAGKSSLLQLLLGELHMKTGGIKVGGELSYATQEAWLFGSTVRGNILFGEEYDKHRYQRVVHVCALEKDFEQFPQGDKTMVGERGVSLSGGQRARINLARAIYRNADLYLMDDPLSAVDTHVGKHLFEECIMSHLSSKTRILVTHQLQFLKKADIIVVLNEGKIEAQGTFEELSKTDFDFTKMLVASDETIEKDEGSEDNAKKPPALRQESMVSVASNEKDQQETKRTEEEIVIPDKSALKVYILSAGSMCMLVFIFLVIGTSQIASSGADYWITFWTDQEERRLAANLTETPETMVGAMLHSLDDSLINGYRSIRSILGYADEYPHYERKIRAASGDEFLDTYVAIYVYTGLIISLITLTIMRSLLFFRAASVASKNLHARIFNSLLQAPMRFFDTNPSGRVLNRFSKDMGAIDEILPRVLSDALQIMLVIIGSLVMIGVSNYWMIIVMFVLAIVFVILRNWFIATAKTIKHVEGITKSPVFSHLNSTLNGISTIRASGAENTLIIQFDNLQNVHTSAWFLTIACMVSFGLWLDVICVIFIACIVFSFIFMNQTGDISGASVGLAISQSLVLTGMLQFGMRQTAEVVNQLTSVERILQYTVLDKEGPFESAEDQKPPKGWPYKGKIKFNNLYLTYSQDDPPVLKNLNISILAAEKIGIVGRTGAGKSSLISALFRLAPLKGYIAVDDVDTQALGLHDVRRNISIIPQEPVLFSATMRYNLDPFGEYEDKNLWNALEEVELKDAVSSLDFQVDEGGANFSVGQRQLICLARAIVRNNKMLVLDEATANVDPRTDGLIQMTIRKKFKDCTVLTIAHRLNTIMDSDKVLVMSSGQMVEFDHPHVLLQNPDGFFTKMVNETGPTMTQALREVSAKAFQAKQEHQKLNESDL